MFEEVVDHAQDGKKQLEEYFNDRESKLRAAAKCVRPTGIILCIIGHYCLFLPVIALLGMIPFVGWLLSGAVVIAAMIFALVVGLTLSTLTIAIAWVFFRPLFGIPLLLCVGVSIYLIFLYDWGAAAVADEDTMPEVMAAQIASKTTSFSALSE